MLDKPQCAKCPRMLCYPNIAVDEKPSFEEAPRFCPSKLKQDIIEKSVREYDREEIREFTRLASVQEFECYERTPDGFRTKIPRIEETVQFAQKNVFKRLGLAFCVGVAGGSADDHRNP